jgi:hypothetical protein
VAFFVAASTGSDCSARQNEGNGCCSMYRGVEKPSEPLKVEVADGLAGKASARQS